MHGFFTGIEADSTDTLVKCVAGILKVRLKGDWFWFLKN